ncbi:MAG TPA: hypothetical protein VLJ80_08545 [Solirubrobacteraceae bacterium]|nr:hypothetical protein [Solirubrobacteraceae bacterium]
MFAVLLLAAGAQADVPGAAGGASEGQEPGTGTTEQQSGEGGWEGAPQEAPQSTGGEGEVTPETPGGETPVETAGETPVETPPPSEPAEAPAPPTEPVQETPVTTLPLENPETAPATAAEESQLSKESTEEGASGGSPAHSSTLLSAAGPSDSSVRAADMLAEQAPSGPPATAAAITAQIGEVSGQEEDSAKAIPMRSAGSQAGRFRCELSALGGKMTDNCTAGWLGGPREVSSAPTSAAVAAVSSLAVAATANSPSGGGHDGSSGLGGSPLTPSPGSAPGGSSGAAGGVGVGGSGAGVSIFITLAGLLLLGAPRALRRLRRAFEPWLAGCFVLIPERPD